MTVLGVFHSHRSRRCRASSTRVLYDPCCHGSRRMAVAWAGRDAFDCGGFLVIAVGFALTEHEYVSEIVEWTRDHTEQRPTDD